MCNIANAQQQYLSATLNNNSVETSLTIHPESTVELGTLKKTEILLAEIPAGTSGYVSFSLAVLSNEDNIIISLENQDRSIYYQMEFANGETMLADHQSTSIAVSSHARSNNLFKIRKCGNKITWLENDIFPIINQQVTSNEELVAKIYSNVATDVSLNALFDITESDCEKCSASNGRALFPNDLMFTGYDNNGNGNQLVLRNLVPIHPTTAFSLVQSISHRANDVWYDETGSNGQLNIHRIVYEGTTTIPASYRFFCLDYYS